MIQFVSYNCESVSFKNHNVKRKEVLMLKLLKYLKTKEWIFALFGVVFIIAQVWLDLKMPDYMNTITQIAQGGINAETGMAYELSDIWENGGYMLLCALGSMACSIITSWFWNADYIFIHDACHDVYDCAKSIGFGQSN